MIDAHHAQIQADVFRDEPLANIEDIDPNGDLVLVIGADVVGTESLYNVEKAVAFRVDYRALARASPVFKDMFDTKNDNYKPGASDAGWTEHLPRDSPKGLKFLFQIAHGGISMLPHNQTLKQIFDIVDMAKKYQMISLLEFKSRSWSSNRRPGRRPPLQPAFTDLTSAKTLFKAFNIGRALVNVRLVENVSHHIVCWSRIVDGHLWYQEEDLENPDLRFEVDWLRKSPLANPLLLQLGVD